VTAALEARAGLSPIGDGAANPTGSGTIFRPRAWVGSGSMIDATTIGAAVLAIAGCTGDPARTLVEHWIDAAIAAYRGVDSARSGLPVVRRSVDAAARDDFAFGQADCFDDVLSAATGPVGAEDLSVIPGAVIDCE
jgi:hypothetical protein